MYYDHMTTISILYCLWVLVT